MDTNETGLQPFEYEVVTVGRWGDTIERTPAAAKLFTENIASGVVLEMVAIPGGVFRLGTRAQAILLRLAKGSPTYK